MSTKLPVLPPFLKKIIDEEASSIPPASIADENGGLRVDTLRSLLQARNIHCGPAWFNVRAEKTACTSPPLEEKTYELSRVSSGGYFWLKTPSRFFRESGPYCPSRFSFPPPENSPSS